jgi:hypothetical protein
VLYLIQRYDIGESSPGFIKTAFKCSKFNSELLNEHSNAPFENLNYESGTRVLLLKVGLLTGPIERSGIKSGVLDGAL